MQTLLACRSDFSIGESILPPEALVEAAVACGQTHVGITDTMTVTGMIPMSQAAEKAGVTPIIGVRLRISDDPFWRPNKDLKEKKKDMPKEYFVTLYARTETGLKAIYRLLSKAGAEPYFYYHAKLGWADVEEELVTLDPADYAVLMGDELGLMQAKDFTKILVACSSKKLSVYLPVVLVDTPYYGRLNKRAIELHQVLPQFPLLAVRPALYGPGDADAQEIMTGIAEGTKYADTWFRSRHNRDLHPMNAADATGEAMKCASHLVKRGLNGAGQMIMKALGETDAFVASFTYRWAKQPPSLPKLAEDEYAALVEECRKGFATRFATPMFGHVPTHEEKVQAYIPRLNYELGVLKNLGFSAYFLIVQDIVRFAKGAGIKVGPGRGSVGGSLVAYLTGITDIDPVRFGLLFERFINPERLDLPDADLDFMSERRHEIVDYLVGKFGADRVAGVSNFTTLGAASAIRDVGRIMGLSEREFGVSKMVPKLHGQPVGLDDAAGAVEPIGEFARNNALIWSIMQRLEGCTRTLSQHAAGVVVAGAPLTEFAVVERRKDAVTVNWDKRTLEEQGLIKLDILGLSTLDVLDLTLRYIEEGTGQQIQINQIPLDDPKVLEAFAQGRTVGVFQFEGGGMRKLLKDLGSMTGSVTFEEITACTALYRPGPMESGMMDSFAKRKQGEEAVEYFHPSVKDFTEETYGILVYQEQVMKTAQAVAGYTGPQADKLRKIMGKKLPEEMAKERDKFVQGCIDTSGVTREWADDLFTQIEGWAGYGFNKSHAAAYSLVSYQSMFLKVYFPLEFYAANMTVTGEDKLLALMREAKASGVTISYPDINKSSDRFELIRGNNEIVIPFQRVKGLSAKTSEAILKAREAGPFLSIEDFTARVEKRTCNSARRASLDAVGAFASIEPSQPSATDPVRIRDQKELLPGLVSDYVQIQRSMHTDKITKDAIIELVDEYRHALGPGAGNDGMPCKTHFGRAAKIMIISDAPGAEEEGNGMIGFARSNNAVLSAMQDADFAMPDVYWTALIKRPKRGGQITSEEIAAYKPYLMREIEILKPTVIVTLGSVVTREFLPALRGKVSDVAGDCIYFKDLDANVVLGFSPGQIWHNPEMQDQMNKIFQVVKELI